jgi:hypothetical protein
LKLDDWDIAYSGRTAYPIDRPMSCRPRTFSICSAETSIQQCYTSSSHQLFLAIRDVNLHSDALWLPATGLYLLSLCPSGRSKPKPLLISPREEVAPLLRNSSRVFVDTYIVAEADGQSMKAAYALPPRFGKERCDFEPSLGTS